MSNRAFGNYPVTEYVLGGLVAGFTLVLMGFAFIAGIRDLRGMRTCAENSRVDRS